jgi:hypothetical protein
MRIFPLHFLLLAAPFAFANEALDVLEGKIDANNVILPPREIPEGEEEGGEEQGGEEEHVENIIYLPPEWAPSPLDAVWSRLVLYDNSGNPIIQQFALAGQYDFSASFGKAQTDKSGVTPARNTDLDGTRSRRARLGARIRAFNNTEIEAMGEFAGDRQYQGIERAKGYTQVSETTGVTYGKFRPNFGTESRLESSLSPYPYQSTLSNMLAPPAALGLSIHHAGETLDYDIGWFSSDFDREFGSLGDDGMLNLSISRTSVERTGGTLSRTTFHVDYIHNFDAGRSNPQGYNIAGQRSANGDQLIVQNPAYRHLFAVGVKSEFDNSTFFGDFQIAKGDSTVWGLTLGATHWIIPGTLNLVGRYQYAGSDDPRGIFALPGNSGDLRYDHSPFFTGDEYHSFYLGSNLHLYKDSLLIRNGVELMILNDDLGQSFNTEAFTWQTGAQISF